MTTLLEVCADSMASAEAAAESGAARIEMCSALHLDGLTPSTAVLQSVRELFPKLKVHVLIRPREGDFVYCDSELAAMERDISKSLPWADGIVCGALTSDGDVDERTMRRLIAASQGKPVTFHRAFDVCRNPIRAFDTIVELGCARLLTSGQHPTAVQGIEMLRELNRRASGRIIVMPGGGVDASNARLIVEQTGCTEIHGSCRGGCDNTQAAEVRRILAALAQ